MSEIYTTTLRLNLDNEDDRRAYEYLRQMDRTRYKSYSAAVIAAINDHFEREARIADDPFLETRERQETFLREIKDTVQAALQTTPLSLGALASLLQPVQKAAPEFSEESLDTAMDFSAKKQTLPRCGGDEGRENDMAIYHWESKVITRGEGRTACGAAAYMSCSRLYNDYDGIQHDYTRKGGLVWEHIFLPTMAPAEWNDRETLWNAVEANEKAKDSQLAREFIVALPVELDADAQVELLTSFIQSVFVADGMCADVSLHDTDGHNPHAHILVTMRPLNVDGTWQYKTEKEYLCVRNGEERGFTAAEFKIAKTEGWEKQYQYKVGKKKTYMAPSEAEAQGLERVSKHPKATRYGRQNPITARWNSKEQVVAWRAAWADAVNHALERKSVEQRVDHRSHAERGLDEKPTIHEGASARKLEQMGFVSDRCELNREIRADNALIRELKALIAKLIKAARMTLAEIARAMEQARQDIIVLTYGIFHNRKGREKDVTGQYQERYDAADAALAQKIDHAKEQFDGLQEQAVEYDRDELTDARLALRQEMESAAHDRIKRNIRGGKVSIRDYWSSISDADALLGETGMAERRREQRKAVKQKRRDYPRL